MKVIVVADIHDHYIDELVELITNKNPDYLLLLWDYGGSWKVIKPLLKLKLPIFAIFWNNDGEYHKTIKLFAKHSDIKNISNTVFDRIEIDNKKVFLTHFHTLAKPMALSWLYDAVFYGHNHIAHQEVIGDCLLANPWSVIGNKTPSSIGVWETRDNSFKIVELPV